MVVRLQRPRRCRRGGDCGRAPTKQITRSDCDPMFDSITVLDEEHREWHERRHHPGGMKSRPRDSTPGWPTARASAKKTLSSKRPRAAARRPTETDPLPVVPAPPRNCGVFHRGQSCVRT